MADADDFNTPPASENSIVQQYLDTNWREAMRAAREGMECLRRIWPELTQHLPETGANHLQQALDRFEAASRALHYAGKHVIGEEAYDEFLEAQTMRQIER